MMGGKRRRQEEAIAALLQCRTVAEAAAAAHLSEATLRRWLQQPAFAAAYKAARREALDQALVLVRETAGDAVATLRCNLGASAPEAVQVRAALGLLDLALKADLRELADDVEELKRRAGLAPGGTPSWT